MTGRAPPTGDQDPPAPDIDASPRAALAWLSSAEPTLDQLLTEPIVQQLMRRDQTDEPTIRHLLREAVAARPTLPATNGPPNTCDSYTIVRLLHETTRACRGLRAGLLYLT